MKIIADENIPFLRGRLEAMRPGGAEVTYVDQFGFTPGLVRDADAVVIRTRTRCDASLLEGSSVRLVATATIGMDQIDLGWCAGRGIEVRNAPGCNAPGVAQYVWASLLRSGFDPARHTLGIVGCGNVGSVVREWGESLGCRMLMSDPPRQEAGIPGEYTPLDRLLAESDAVTLHTPLTLAGPHATRHLIGERELALMRDGAILVNAARGPVVDFEALRPEVTGGRLRAIIDTWEGEPRVDRAILDAALYATFHIAGYSLQGKQRATRMAIEAVERAFGVEVDKSGLEQAYAGLPGVTAADIMASYDPAADTAALRAAPDDFDRLRHDYEYRRETRVGNASTF